MTRRAQGMKRKNIERVLAAHLPDRWMTAGAIIDYIHNLPGTLGINGIQKRSFPTTTNSLSQKIRGSKVLDKRHTDPSDERSVLEYRLTWKEEES